MPFGETMNKMIEEWRIDLLAIWPNLSDKDRDDINQLCDWAKLGSQTEEEMLDR